MLLNKTATLHSSSGLSSQWYLPVHLPVFSMVLVWPLSSHFPPYLSSVLFLGSLASWMCFSELPEPFTLRGGSHANPWLHLAPSVDIFQITGQSGAAQWIIFLDVSACIKLNISFLYPSITFLHSPPQSPIHPPPNFTPLCLSHGMFYHPSGDIKVSGPRVTPSSTLPQPSHY